MRKGGGARAGRADARLRSFLAADWVQWMREAPETATVVGFPGLNDRWSDDSPKGIATRQRHLEEAVAELGKIRPASLGPAERLNHRLYRDLLQTALRGRRFGDDPFPFHFGYPRNLWMPINQMDGLHVTAGQLLPMQPRRNAADYRATIGRLRGLPALVEQHLALMEEGRRRGYMPPRVAIGGLPGQVLGLVPEAPEGSALWVPFQNFPAGIDAAERERLAAEARESYSREVRPAFLKLHRYLEASYLPAARATMAATELPDGTAAYAHHVRWTTTTEHSPREIHEIGLAEVRRTRASIEELVRSTGFAGSLAAFHQSLRGDPRFRYASAEQLVESYRSLTKRIDPELAYHFGRLPRLPYGVMPVPDFQAPSVPAAYYIAGSPPDGRPGIFYVNSYRVEGRPTWRRESLALHEAVPGHHLQIALANELEDVPEFRKHNSETAFVEGWGLYAESLGEELGLYRDPYQRFGALDHDIWRSVRLVVDTGMHALGWSRDRAIEFFRENTGMNENEIAVEVDRYIVWPSQALAYKLGQLKIRELRTLAETTLGDRFDERAFHDVVLAQGGIPLGVLEARVRDWLAGLAPRRRPPRSKARGARRKPRRRR